MANKPSAAAFLSDIGTQEAQPSIGKPSASAFLSDLPESTNTQKSGFIPTKEDLMGMLPKPQEIPALVGSTAGTLARTTGVGALYSALGAATGEAGTQLAQRAGIMPGTPPQTMTEAATNIGKKALLGAGGEVFGRKVISPALGWLGKKIFPGAEPAVQEAVSLAEKEGIKPLPSMISKSKAVAGTERALEFSPFGTSISDARAKAVEEFGNYAKNVGNAISPNRAPEINSALAKEAGKGYYETFNEVKNKLYESALPQIADRPVDPTPAIQALNEMATSAEKRVEKGTVNYAKAILKRISDPNKPPTFNDIKELATGVGYRTKFRDPTNPGMQGYMKKVYGSLKDVLDNGINQYGDELLKQDLNKANSYFQEGKTVLGSKIYKALMAVPQGNEYKIAFNAKDPMAYETIKDIVGPDVMRGLARQWFESDIIGKATKGGMISPQIMLNLLNKKETVGMLERIGEDFPGLTDKISDLNKVASLMTRNSDVMKGSQTAPLYTMLGTLGEILTSISQAFSHPIAAAGGLATGAGYLGASKVGTELATSDFGRNLLTRGYPAIQKGVEKAAGAVTTPSVGLGLSRFLDKEKK